MFDELVKTTVHIGIGKGKYIEVPMLTVEDFNTFKELQRNLAELNSASDTTELQRIDAIIEGRGKLAAMAAKVMPKELHENLKRMDYPTISMLVMVLCTGKDNSEDDDPEKKTALPSQLA
ncbi:MAG: hypothetical protein IKK15_03015 [Akkermansia sp.]|nr:hypothetical protein [Akkermansia sp.]